MTAPDSSVPDDPFPALLAANPNDVATLLIYADQFEERGDLVRAQFLRNEHALRSGAGPFDTMAETQRKLAERIAKAGHEAWFEVINHPKLRGTTWEGTSDNFPFTARFIENGELNYTQSSGTYQNGLWKQRGSLVTFEMNRGYAEYTGLIFGMKSMVGKARNVVHKKWDWNLAPEALAVEIPQETNTTVYRYAHRKLDKPAKKPKKRRATPAAGRAKPAAKAAAKPAAKATSSKKSTATKPVAKPTNKPTAKKPATTKPPARPAVKPTVPKPVAKKATMSKPTSAKPPAKKPGAAAKKR